jgi:hypothetical protein
MSSPVWYWLLPMLICAPWIAGIVWIWSRLPKDDWLPESVGARALRRLQAR